MGAHADDSEQVAYLASLPPDADLDLRGSTIDERLLSRILTAMTDPTIQRPTLGDARLESATFTGKALFASVVFTGTPLLGPLVCVGTVGAVGDGERGR